MRVLSYKYILPNDNGIVSELERQGYMTPQYIRMMEEYLLSIELKGKCAVLYAGGVLLNSSEARNVDDNGKHREHPNNSTVCIKEVAAYNMHRWIGMLNGKENIQYANINGNTCASSMYSLYEAEQLLNNGYDQVVVIAEEKTAYNTLRIFDEHNIDLKVGEGCVVIHLGQGEGISECKWSYEYNRNPFGVTESGYRSVYNECDIVKPHGTGTDNNEVAETAVYGDTPQLRYKEKYGHTQGVSGLLEVCLTIEENMGSRILCVSSGLGGFYGSCIIQK